MRKSITRILFGLLVVGAVLMLNPGVKSRPTAVLAETNGCRLATLNGAYGFAFSGSVNTGPGSFTPIAAAGTIAFREDGSISRSFNASFGGSVFPVSDSGIYALNEDCTFTAILPSAGETWNLIPVEQGLQIEFFVNTAGRVGAGTLTHK